METKTLRELVCRLNYLHTESDRRPQDDGVPLADILDAIAIIEELRRRHEMLTILFYMEERNER